MNRRETKIFLGVMKVVGVYSGANYAYTLNDNLMYNHFIPRTRLGVFGWACSYPIASGIGAIVGYFASSVIGPYVLTRNMVNVICCNELPHPSRNFPYLTPWIFL